jgi:hypothetical protein
MKLKTVEQILSEHPSYKSVSFYNAITSAIKNGALSGKAIAINRNDPNAKFKIAKATSRGGKSAMRDVLNYVIIDMDAFELWFETAKNGIRTVKTINRTQMTMPHLGDVLNGSYTPEQLNEMAIHMASKRYGKSGATKKPAPTTTGKRGRPAKTKKS